MIRIHYCWMLSAALVPMGCGDSLQPAAHGEPSPSVQNQKAPDGSEPNTAALEKLAKEAAEKAAKEAEQLANELAGKAAQKQEQAAAKKDSVPDEKSLADAEKKMRAAFDDDFRDAKTPAQKLDLARRLLSTAIDSSDDKPAAFVLLRAGGNLATSANNLEMAWSAWETLENQCNVDGLQLSLDSLVKVASAAKEPEQYSTLLKNHEELIEKAITADRFELLDGIAASAEKLAAIGRDAKVIFAWKARREDMSRLSAAFAAASKGKSTLVTAPDDAKAHADLGRFLCFVKLDWDNGLKHLMKGDDEKLRTLAELEYNRTEKGANLALGDGWLEVAKTMNGKTREACLARSKSHYEEAVSFASGLDKAVAGRRLAELNKESERIEAVVGSEEGADDKSVESPLVIHAAFYGQNVNWLDVTDKLREIVRDKNEWATVVNTADWGDPAPGYTGPRTLIIRYTARGVTKSTWAYQGDKLAIP